ncbi:MAG: hypothetical protein WCT05_07160 [Lentisphaeria bacterium]
MKKSKFNKISRFFALWLLLLLAASAIAGQTPKLTLPRQAEILFRSPDGRGWLQTGIVKLSYSATLSSFAVMLEDQGWCLEKTIDLSDGHRHYCELFLWRQEKTKIMVMLWEDNPQQCGFSWGVE